MLLITNLTYQRQKKLQFTKIYMNKSIKFWKNVNFSNEKKNFSKFDIYNIYIYLIYRSHKWKLI